MSAGPGHESGRAPRDKRGAAGRGRRKRKPSAVADIDVARRIVRELDALARTLLSRELGGQTPGRPIGPVPVALEARPGGRGEVQEDRRAEALLAALGRRVQRVSDGVVPFRPGRVYCFWCRSNACDHGAPATAREVFIGFEPTGRPRFNDFADLALARGAPGIEGIYRDPPQPTAIHDDGRALRADQLGVFGRSSTVFRVVGQVAVGYLPFRLQTGACEPFALTVQVTEVRRRDGAPLLDLNVLGAPPEGTLESWIDTAFDGAVLEMVGRSRRRVRDLGRRMRGRAGRSAVETEVASVLNDVARNLERFCRQAGRRTGHAKERRREGGRPTGMALEDARRAADGAIFRDEKHATLIVLAARGRTHVFSPGGRHITSISYSREAIARKQKLRIWLPAGPDEAERLRNAINRSRTGPSPDDRHTE